MTTLDDSAGLLSLPAHARHRSIAGFWRRLFAFAIDALITAVPCGILGYSFYSYFSRSAIAGLLIGFVLTLPYFAVLGSSIGRGQTVGHRITSVKVVDREGHTISFTQSFYRYAILLVPILLSSEVLPNSAGFWIKTCVDWVLSLALTAIIYLYVFNRNTRQSLHDLVVGAYVVDETNVGEIEVSRFWGWHWMILGGGAIVTAILLGVFANTIGQIGPFSELISIEQAILASGKVRSVGISAQTNWENGVTTRSMGLNVAWKGEPRNFEQNATEIVDIALRADPKVGERNIVTVRFLEGFKIGFATFSYNRQISHDLAEWTKLIKELGP